MASPTQWTEFEQRRGGGEGQGSLASRSPGGCVRVAEDWATEENTIILTSHRLTAPCYRETPHFPVFAGSSTLHCNEWQRQEILPILPETSAFCACGTVPPLKHLFSNSNVHDAIWRCCYYIQSEFLAMCREASWFTLWSIITELLNQHCPIH